MFLVSHLIPLIPQILLLNELNHLEDLPPMTSMRENITSCYLVLLKSRMVRLALNDSILIMMRCPMFYTDLMRILIMSTLFVTADGLVGSVPCPTDHVPYWSLLVLPLMSHTFYQREDLCPPHYLSDVTSLPPSA